MFLLLSKARAPMLKQINSAPSDPLANILWRRTLELNLYQCLPEVFRLEILCDRGASATEGWNLSSPRRYSSGKLSRLVAKPWADLADNSEYPIIEVEVVMKRGSPADLLVLADSLDRVRAGGALTKSGRSYALAGGDEPGSFKAEPIELKPDMTAAEAFQIVARACFRQFRLNEPMLIAHRSAEPLHQARVAMRRLRSALSLFKSVVADQEYERFKRGLRDLSHKLGEARDLDVDIARSKVSNVGDSSGLPPPALESAGRLQAERDRTYRRVISALQSKRFRLLMRNFVAWIEAGPWCTWDESRTARDQTILYFAAHGLEHRWRKLKHGGRHLDRLSSEEHHQIRIDAKKMRYASEFFSSLMADPRHRKRHKVFIAALESLQTRLGDLNDVQTEREIAARLARPEAPAARGSDAVRRASGHSGKQKESMAALVGLASKAHRQLLDARPFWKS
jgi:triphosphatase